MSPSAGGDDVLARSVSAAALLRASRRNCRARRSRWRRNRSADACSSRAVYSGLVLTTVRPARRTPNIAIGYCSTFGSMIATRSPLLSLQVVEQIRGELAAQLVDFGVGQRPAHVRKRRSMTEIVAGGFQHVGDRSDRYSHRSGRYARPDSWPARAVVGIRPVMTRSVLARLQHGPERVQLHCVRIAPRHDPHDRRKISRSCDFNTAAVTYAGRTAIRGDAQSRRP